MDSELQKLRARAATQADVFAAHPLAEVVLVTGSVALGVVDEASDIDLMVYYQALPPAGELTAMRDAALANDGGVYSFNPDEGLACFFFVDGIRIEGRNATNIHADTVADGGAHSQRDF